jgi:hypothetical protein
MLKESIWIKDADQDCSANDIEKEAAEGQENNTAIPGKSRIQ